VGTWSPESRSSPATAMRSAREVPCAPQVAAGMARGEEGAGIPGIYAIEVGSRGRAATRAGAAPL